MSEKITEPPARGGWARSWVPIALAIVLGVQVSPISVPMDIPHEGLLLKLSWLVWIAFDSLAVRLTYQRQRRRYLSPTLAILIALAITFAGTFILLALAFLASPIA